MLALPVLKKKKSLRPAPERRRGQQPQQREVVRDLEWTGDSANTLTREQGEALRECVRRTPRAAVRCC